MSRATFTLVGLAVSAAEDEGGAAVGACDGVPPLGPLPEPLAWLLDGVLEDGVLEKDVWGV